MYNEFYLGLCMKYHVFVFLLISLFYSFTMRRFIIKKPSNINIVNYGSYRGWSNGTYPSTCDAYKNPVSGYSYSGATGDGIYRITLNGSPVDVYCLMSYNSYGWVMLGGIWPGQRNTTYAYGSTEYSSTANFVSFKVSKYYSINTTQALVYVSSTGTTATDIGMTNNAYNLVTFSGVSKMNGASEVQLADNTNTKFFTDAWNTTSVALISLRIFGAGSGGSTYLGLEMDVMGNCGTSGLYQYFYYNGSSVVCKTSSPYTNDTIKLFFR